jgi:small subunit ribosomal protein S18
MTNEVMETEQSAPAAQQPAAPPRPEGRTEERGTSGDRRPQRGGRFGGGRGGRRKVCAFCVDKIDVVDYKDPAKLRRYVTDRGKIEARRKTGTCARHQRRLTVAIKRARHLALLPYTGDHSRSTGLVTPPPPRAEAPPEPAPAPAEAPAQQETPAADETANTE